MLKLDFLSNDYKEKKTPAQIAEEAIEIDIITGKIPAGKRINEQDICKRFNMSRTPVREILRRIEGNGLAKSIPNRGVFAVGLSQQDLDDFFYLKTILEVQCVRWAIERITEDQLELLGETFDFMQFYTMSNDLDKMLRINEGFDTSSFCLRRSSSRHHLCNQGRLKEPIFHRFRRYKFRNRLLHHLHGSLP